MSLFDSFVNYLKPKQGFSIWEDSATVEFMTELFEYTLPNSFEYEKEKKKLEDMKRRFVKLVDEILHEQVIARTKIKDEFKLSVFDTFVNNVTDILTKTYKKLDEYFYLIRRFKKSCKDMGYINKGQKLIHEVEMKYGMAGQYIKNYHVIHKGFHYRTEFLRQNPRSEDIVWVCCPKSDFLSKNRKCLWGKFPEKTKNIN